MNFGLAIEGERDQVGPGGEDERQVEILWLGESEKGLANQVIGVEVDEIAAISPTLALIEGATISSWNGVDLPEGDVQRISSVMVKVRALQPYVETRFWPQLFAAVEDGEDWPSPDGLNYHLLGLEKDRCEIRSNLRITKASLTRSEDKAFLERGGAVMLRVMILETPYEQRRQWLLKGTVTVHKARLVMRLMDDYIRDEDTFISKILLHHEEAPRYPFSLFNTIYMITMSRLELKPYAEAFSWQYCFFLLKGEGLIERVIRRLAYGSEIRGWREGEVLDLAECLNRYRPLTKGKMVLLGKLNTWYQAMLCYCTRFVFQGTTFTTMRGEVKPLIEDGFLSPAFYSDGWNVETSKLAMIVYAVMRTGLRLEPTGIFGPDVVNVDNLSRCISDGIELDLPRMVFPSTVFFSVPLGHLEPKDVLTLSLAYLVQFDMVERMMLIVDSGATEKDFLELDDMVTVWVKDGQDYLDNLFESNVKEIYHEVDGSRL